MPLTLYLFTSQIKSFEQALQPSDLECCSVPFVKELSTNLPFPHALYRQINVETQSAWLDDLSPYFAVNQWNAKNQHSSAVLLLQVEGRILAASFGRGHLALRPDIIEPEFGIRCVLAGAQERAFKRLSTRTIGRNSRNRSTGFHSNHSVDRFGIEVGQDSVCELHARLDNSDFAKSIGGSAALRLTGKLPLHILDQIGSKALQLFTMKGKPEDAWLFPHVALTRREIAAENLEELLTAALVQRSPHLEFGTPELEEDTQDVQYRFRYRSVCSEPGELDLVTLYHYFDQQGIKGDRLSGLTVEAINSDGQILLSIALARLFIGEWDERVYFLGRWYRLNPDYVQLCRKRLETLPDLSDRLLLPKREGFRTEGEYNKHVATEKDWILLDKENFYMEGQQRAESGDLLTSNSELICLKKMSSSSTTSHLGAQAVVSAQLFRSYPEFRDRLAARFREKWPHKELDPNPTMVYAISTNKNGPLWKSIFGFSAINLIGQINRIHSLGFRVALCKVEEAAVGTRSAQRAA